MDRDGGGTLPNLRLDEPCRPRASEEEVLVPLFPEGPGEGPRIEPPDLRLLPGHVGGVDEEVRVEEDRLPLLGEGVPVGNGSGGAQSAFAKARWISSSSSRGHLLPKEDPGLADFPIRPDLPCL